MPADEVTHGADVDESRVRSGPRHAAPKKPLFTRFHMPAGKAIASVAMPTAVLVGLGFTSSLALADGNGSTPPSAKSLTADEYKDCVSAVEGAKDADASPTPSASAGESSEEATPSAAASGDAEDDAQGDAKAGADAKDGSSSSDSGSDDKARPGPSASGSAASETAASGSANDSADAATPSPSASPSSRNVLQDLGDALTGIFTGGIAKATESAQSTQSATPTPSASASPDGGKDLAGTVEDTTGAVKDTTDKLTKTADDTVKGTAGKASGTLKDTGDAVKEAAEPATSSPGPSSSPSPSASATTSADDCPVATDDTGGVDNKVPVADDPWYLNASSLLLKGADYQGVVEVRTADGTTKKVLKYVISDGTDIGDLHQTVNDKQSGKVYHVQAAKGSTSTIRDGETVMYTESISGNLLGLIPVTFSPDSPPPLNIPLIYFTNVKVVQAAQFGGSLHVPGMHVYTTD